MNTDATMIPSTHTPRSTLQLPPHHGATSLPPPCSIPHSRFAHTHTHTHRQPHVLLSPHSLLAADALIGSTLKARIHRRSNRNYPNLTRIYWNLFSLTASPSIPDIFFLVVGSYLVIVELIFLMLSCFLCAILIRFIKVQFSGTKLKGLYSETLRSFTTYTLKTEEVMSQILECFSYQKCRNLVNFTKTITKKTSKNTVPLH